MDFEWNDAKSDANRQKHGVAFTEAMTVFADRRERKDYEDGNFP